MHSTSETQFLPNIFDKYCLDSHYLYCPLKHMVTGPVKLKHKFGTTGCDVLVHNIWMNCNLLMSQDHSLHLLTRHQKYSSQIIQFFL